MLAHSAAPSQPAENRSLATAVWLTPVVLCGALLVAESYSHTIFHTLAEVFAVIVALLAAVVGWQAYTFSRNNFLVYLSSGYLWIGLLDLAHALTYKGLGILPGESGNIAIQLWVGTRYVEAALLLTAPFAIARVPRRRDTALLFGAAALAIAWLVATGLFPTAFVPGVGLTRFKVTSEYLIIALLLAAFIHLWIRRAALDRRIVALTLASIALTAASEFFLTVYQSVGDLPTIVAHLLKIVSYWLIFVATAATTLTEPFRILARGASSFEAVPDPTVVVDDHGIIRQTNRAARRHLGLDDAGCIGRHCHDLFHSRTVSREECPICQAIASRQGLDEYIEQLPERREWHRFSLSPITVGASTLGVVHVSLDVTQQVNDARAMRESEARFRGLVESSSDWVWEVDEELRYTYASPQVRQILGYEPGELIGKSPLDLMPPEEAEHIREVCVHAITHRHAVKTLENSNYHRDGYLVVLETSFAPYFDGTGIFRGFRGIDRDITERKQVERELDAHRNHLERLVAERTAALETANRQLSSFSYSVSHDLRAPLRAIDGYSQILLMECGAQLDPEAAGLLGRITRAAGRMNTLIDALLQLSQLGHTAMRIDVVDLSEMVEEIGAELRNANPEREVRLDVEPGLRAPGDSTLLRVALSNLLNNAWKFTAGRSPARIAFGACAHKGHPCYWVRDNGAGFDMRTAGKLFTAFQRLHNSEEFPGTGIGLATVQRVIARHGGKVWAEAETDKGATFYFTLGLTLHAENDKLAPHTPAEVNLHSP